MAIGITYYRRDDVYQSACINVIYKLSQANHVSVSFTTIKGYHIMNPLTYYKTTLNRNHE